MSRRATRVKMTPEAAKENFEDRINTAAKALAGIGVLVENNAELFTMEQVAKAHLYLANQLMILRNDMDTAVKGNVVVKGGAFSLDGPMEAPVSGITYHPPALAVSYDPAASIVAPGRVPTISPVSPTPDLDDDALSALEALEGREEIYADDKATMTTPARRRKAEGRLVGSKEVLWTDVDAPKEKNPSLMLDDATTVPDKDTGYIAGAGFLDE